MTMCNICYQWFGTSEELTEHLKNIKLKTMCWCTKCALFWEPHNECLHSFGLKTFYCSLCKVELCQSKFDQHVCFHHNENVGDELNKESNKRANISENNTEPLFINKYVNYMTRRSSRNTGVKLSLNPKKIKTIRKTKKKYKELNKLNQATIYIKAKYKFVKARKKYIEQVKKIKEGFYEKNDWEDSSDSSDGETEFKESKELFTKISDEETSLCWYCLQELPLLLLTKHESNYCHNLKQQTEPPIVSGSITQGRRIKMHKDERSLCYICGQMPRRKYFRNHRRTHQPKGSAVMCEICGVTTSSITQHMLSHTEERIHSCEKCGKAFKRKKTLRIHRLVHTSIGKHVCPTCGKDFKVSYNLRVHMRSHMNKKPFECQMCDKTFTTKQWRDNHMKTHK